MSATVKHNMYDCGTSVVQYLWHNPETKLVLKAKIWFNEEAKTS